MKNLIFALLFVFFQTTNAASAVNSTFSTALSVQGEPFQYKFSVDTCQDNYGFIYMTGSQYLPGFNGSDVFVAVFNSSGGMVSLLSLSSSLATSSSNDYSYGIVCNSKEVFIVGETSSVFAGTSKIGTIDGFVAKISLNATNSLELTWIERFGVASSNTSGQGIDIGDDFVVVTGWTTGDLDGEQGSAGKNATFIRQMSQSSGSLNWAKLYGNSTISVAGIGIALDNSNNSYVVGNTAAGTSFCAGGYSGTKDIFVIQVDSSGNLMWCNQIGSPQSDDAVDILFQIDSVVLMSTMFSSVIDNHGQILGISLGSSDAVLVRYALNGTWKDATFIGSSSPDVALGMATNIQEEIYIIGAFFNPLSLNLARFPAYPQYNFTAKIDWSAGFSDTTYNYMSSILGSYNNSDIFYVTEVLDPILLASPDYYLVGVLETRNATTNSSSSSNSSATLSSVTTGSDNSTTSTTTSSTIGTTSTTSTTSPQQSDAGSGSGNAVVISVAVVVSVVAISVGVAGVFFGYRMSAQRRIRQSQFAMHSEDPTPQSGAKTNNATTNYATFNTMGPVVTTQNVEPQKKDQWEIPYSEITLGKELGKGAFGVVYLARWRSADCVVKQLDINSEDPQAVNLFLKEATNVKNLRTHPNVCTMYGVCTHPKSPICIVMEYMSEGSLWNMITEKRIEMTLHLVVQFAKEVASAMSHLHAENILHCDLACRNILVAVKGKSYTVKVADFGLSRIIGAETYTVTNSNATFPIRWTAPETLVTRTISRANDVWSYGITLWEMAEGKYPYLEMSHNDVIQQVCLGDYRLPRPGVVQVPDTLWKLVLKCWDKNPANRPTFPELYEELTDIENSKSFN